MTSPIGILGGMGPQAGLDLHRNVLAETRATSDQDHLPCLLYSETRIPDRTTFLLGRSAVDPARPMAQALERMAIAGATVAGIACNTAHADPIFNAVRTSLDERLAEQGLELRLLHMMDETIDAIRTHHPKARRIAILGTQGTYRFRLYDRRLETAGYEVVLPSVTLRNGLLHDTIYHPVWGVKAESVRVTKEARDGVHHVIDHVLDAGADLVILGCTELPLAIRSSHPAGPKLIDATRMLARALIREAAPDRLRPY